MEDKKTKNNEVSKERRRNHGGMEDKKTNITGCNVEDYTRTGIENQGSKNKKILKIRRQR